MINQSKKNDLRFRRKWRAAGAVSSGNEHFDKCTSIAARLELEGKPLEAGCMRVFSYNDYSNWEPVTKSPLGEIVPLHQVYEGSEECLYCGKPIDKWNPGERCSVKAVVISL